jgi:hypothetical protein
MKTILTLPLQKKRDLLRARQMTRHTAALLGFNPQDQICLAAAVFDLSCQALKATGCAMLRFAIGDDRLLIACDPAQGQLQLSKPLPGSAAVPRDDVPWMLKQLLEMATGDWFEEVCRVNQELLQTLLGLAQGHPQQAGTAVSKPEPSAA